MRLQQLGWNSDFQHQFSLLDLQHCIPARVAEENKGLYRVFAEPGEFLAGIPGRLRFRADARIDLPAIGDWVAITARVSEARATIEAILPRKTILSRKETGKRFDEQIIATNLDIIFVVTSLNLDLNERRLERYLAIIWNSGAQPVVILNKTDLCSEPESFRAIVQNIAPAVAVHAMSAVTGEGLSQIQSYLEDNKTAAFIGSSGVGKSTIINALAGDEIQRVQAIREWDNRGRHTTTSKQMFLLPNGGIVIDTPGIRLVGLWDNDEGLSKTFQDLQDVAAQCRFRDCSHTCEPGCAVLQEVEEGTLDPERVEGYRKLQAELKFMESKTNFAIQRASKAHSKRTARAMKRFYKQR